MRMKNLVSQTVSGEGLEIYNVWESNKENFARRSEEQTADSEV